VQLATRYSKLPDEVIYAAEAGWCHEARYTFNDAVTGYVEQFERMREAYDERPAPRPRGKPKYTKRVPRYTEDELLAYLGIDAEDQVAQQIIEQAIPPSAWDTFDDGDWITDPETVA